VLTRALELVPSESLDWGKRGARNAGNALVIAGIRKWPFASGSGRLTADGDRTATLVGAGGVRAIEWDARKRASRRWGRATLVGSPNGCGARESRSEPIDSGG
jgi:hypothetical protein